MGKSFKAGEAQFVVSTAKKEKKETWTLYILALGFAIALVVAMGEGSAANEKKPDIPKQPHGHDSTPHHPVPPEPRGDAVDPCLDVKLLQTRLQQQLGDRTPTGFLVDGIYGPLTEQAVLQVQDDAGLVVDGIAGPNTQRALGMCPGGGRPTMSRIHKCGVCAR